MLVRMTETGKWLEKVRFSLAQQDQGLFANTGAARLLVSRKLAWPKHRLPSPWSGWVRPGGAAPTCQPGTAAVRARQQVIKQLTDEVSLLARGSA